MVRPSCDQCGFSSRIAGVLVRLMISPPSLGHGVEIPEFVAGVVLLVDDPFAIGGPGGAVLPLVGLGQLNRPSAGGAHLPQIGAAGNVTGEYDLLPVGRPGGAENTLCVVKVVDGRGPGGRV